jgi:hypothetical protein
LRNISYKVDVAEWVAMSGEDAAYNFDRYRRLLAEADDEPKRLALINLLIAEKARERLANHMLRSRLSGLDKTEVPSQISAR